jgi:hypothetical protein
MVNNLKGANKLEGTGLAGENSGQAKSTNKMNIVMNKLIKALNQYMEAPAVAASPAANKKNAANTSNSISINASAVTSTVTAAPTANKRKPVNVSNSISINASAPTARVLNKGLINTNKPTPVANNHLNKINHLEQIANKSKEIVNANHNNAKKNKYSTNPLATRKNRVGLMKTQTFKGGKLTRYNKHKSVKNRK